MPSPVARFDWHEGSGTTTTDTLGGGYTLTLFGGGSAFVAGGGTRGAWGGGAVGPTGTQTDWTLVLESTHNAYPGGVDNFGNDGDQPWFNFDNTGHPGPWSPDQYGTVPIPLNVRTTTAWVFTGTDSKVYVNGTLSGTFASVYTTDFGTGWVLNGNSGFIIHTARTYDVALSAAEVAALSAPPGTPAAAALLGAGALTSDLAVAASNFVFYTGTGGLHAGATAVGPVLPPTAQPVWVSPSARDYSRTYMLAQLSARGITGPWSSSIPAQRPPRFFTIEDLNSATEYGAAADSQLIQIRGYDTDRKRLGDAMRLIKGLWAVMPRELIVQSVEHAGGPLYDEDPDVPGLYYGQVIAWVTVMNQIL